MFANGQLHRPFKTGMILGRFRQVRFLKIVKKWYYLDDDYIVFIIGHYNKVGT